MSDYSPQDKIDVSLTCYAEAQSIRDWVGDQQDMWNSVMQIYFYKHWPAYTAANPGHVWAEFALQQETGVDFITWVFFHLPKVREQVVNDLQEARQEQQSPVKPSFYIALEPLRKAGGDIRGNADTSDIAYVDPPKETDDEAGN